MASSAILGEQIRLIDVGVCAAAYRRCASAERPPLDFYKMLTELRYIGNNMNQLTRIAHATGRIDREKFERLTDEIKPLASMLVSLRYGANQTRPDDFQSLGTYIRKSDQKALKEKREEERKWRNKIWKINGWIGDCLLYIENPNKTQNRW